MTRASFGRHTGPIVTDATQTAALEARNALLQFDEIRRLISDRMGNLQLSGADISRLQAIAVQEIWDNPGQFRDGPIGISNTPHQPPEANEVPRLVDEMCDYANAHQLEPLHVSAYLMWRLNWIHPFKDGNGRTSRAVSYLALCCGFGMDLPGTKTVPDLIVNNKNPYYAALDAADAAYKKGEIDVSVMESLISELLTVQLESV